MLSAAAVLSVVCSSSVESQLARQLPGFGSFASSDLVPSVHHFLRIQSFSPHSIRRDRFNSTVRVHSHTPF